jgi:hypothetical protein
MRSKVSDFTCFHNLIYSPLVGLLRRGICRSKCLYMRSATQTQNKQAYIRARRGFEPTIPIFRQQNTVKYMSYAVRQVYSCCCIIMGYTNFTISFVKFYISYILYQYMVKWHRWAGYIINPYWCVKYQDKFSYRFQLNISCRVYSLASFWILGYWFLSLY